MRLLKQSSTAQPLMFFLAQSADHITGLASATATVTLCKSGAGFVTCSGAISEVANGWYKVAGNATDTGTLGPLILHAAATSADPTDVEYTVVAFDPQIATNLGLSALPTANPGAASGVLISGASNSGTTTFGGIVGGAVSMSSLNNTGVTTFSGFTAGATTFSGVTTGALTLSSVNNTGNSTFAGAVSLGSTLAVTGATTYAGNVSLGANLTVTGNTTFTGNLTGTLSHVTLTDTTTTLTNAPPDSSGVTTLLSRIPSALFSGITSLGNWLRTMARSTGNNQTAIDEINADLGADIGHYDPEQQSLDAMFYRIGAIPKVRSTFPLSFTENFAYGASAVLTGQTNGGYTWADDTVLFSPAGTSFGITNNALVSRNSAINDANQIELVGINFNCPWTVSFNFTHSTAGRRGLEMQLGDIGVTASGGYFFLEFDASGVNLMDLGIGGFWAYGRTISENFAGSFPATPFTFNVAHAMEWSHDGYGKMTLKMDGVTLGTTIGTPPKPEIAGSFLRMGSYRISTTGVITIDNLVVTANGFSDDIAAAVLDPAISDHTDAGSVGEAIDTSGGGGTTENIDVSITNTSGTVS